MEIAGPERTSLCFGCGQANPIGLKLKFLIEDGKVRAEFVPASYHQGWNSVLHGGLLALCLDEAFGWVLYSQGIKAMTARMDLRFRKTVRIGQKIRITGEIRKRSRKLIETYAKAELEDGTLAAEATATMFVTAPDSA